MKYLFEAPVIRLDSENFNYVGRHAILPLETPKPQANGIFWREVFDNLLERFTFALAFLGFKIRYV